MMFAYLRIGRAVMVTMVFLSCPWCLGADLTDASFLGQERPGLMPVVFAPGIVSVPGRFEAGVTFTPDGLECCVTVTNAAWSSGNIEYLQYVDGAWSASTRAYFIPSGTDNGFCHFSPDGLRFFFLSMRTGNQDLWMSQRSSTQERWSAPSLIPAPVSLSGPREFTPSATLDGTLYFYSSHRDGGHGGNDIWRSPWIDGHYNTVENIGPPVNDAHDQSTPFIAPDESYLIFSAINVPDSYGSHDLYISFRDSNDTWTGPRNLGSRINTEYGEADPYVSIDGRYFFFTRRTDREADIYWVSTAAFMPDPNGPIENLTSGARFGNVQLAIDEAKRGDTLVVPLGTYQESLTIDKDIVLTSIDPNDPLHIGGTIIEGTSDGPTVTLTGNSADCEIAGLTVRNGSVGIMGTSTQAVLRNCRIMDNTGHGLELSEVSSPWLDQCLITNNGAFGIMMHPKIGRYTVYCEPIIEDCVIAQNSAGSLEGGAPVIMHSIISE